MNYYTISFSLTFIISFTIALFVLKKDPKKKINIIFSLFAFSVSLWSFCYVLFSIANNNMEALFWNRWLMAGAIIIPVTFMHFVLVYLESEKKYRLSIIFNYLIALFFLLILPAPLFIKNEIPLYGFRFWPNPGILFHPYLIWFGFNTILAHLLLFKRLAIKTIKHTQTKYIFIGSLIGFVGGSTNFFMWYKIPIPPIGSPLVAIYVLILAYAIVKHHLMDIRVVVNRIAAFSIVCIIHVLFGTFLIFIYSQFFILTFNFISLLFLGILFILAGISFHPLRLLIQTTPDKFLFRKKYLYDQAIKEMAEVSTESLKRKEVVEKFSGKLKETIKTKKADVFLAQNDGSYQKQ